MGANIEQLSHLHARSEDDEQRAALSWRIVELSTFNRVLSDRTALTIPGTERDYERYGVDTNALADILTVGSAGLELHRRSDLTMPEFPLADAGRVK